MRRKVFESENRNSLVDLISPPSGYLLDSAIGTTYSVDFVALTSVMLGLVNAETEEDQKTSIPIQLAAFARLAKKIRLFVNRSSIHCNVNSNSNKVHAIYDELIEEMAVDHGSFHPKVWLLKYTPKETPEGKHLPPLFRLLCGSRNTTSSNMLEFASVIDGKRTADGSKTELGQQISFFFESLLKSSSSEAEPFISLLNEVASVDFEVPSSFAKKVRLHFQTPGQTQLIDSIPDSGDTAVCVSPFLSKSFVKTLAARFDEVWLISTRSELDAKLRDLEPDSELKIYYVDNPLSVDRDSPWQLHAKIFLFESGKERTMFVGSANASTHAWQGNNHEAVLELQGKYRPSHFLNQFVFIKETGQHERTLAPWITEYEPDEASDEKTDDELAEEDLNALVDGLGGFQFELRYAPGFENQRPSLLVRPISDDTHIKFLGELVEKIDINVLPLGSVDTYRGMDWPSLSWPDFINKGAEFAIELKELSQFLCFKLRHRETDREKAIVLKANSVDFTDRLEDRTRSLLRSQLNASQFADFLKALLFDEVWASSGDITDIIGGSGGANRNVAFNSKSISIEDVMRSCTEDESRIAEVSNVIKTFEGEDEKGNPYLSAQFRRFWVRFISAFDISERV